MQRGDEVFHPGYNHKTLRIEDACAVTEEERIASIKAEALEPLREKFQRDADDAEKERDVTAQLHWLLAVMHIEILQKKYRKQGES